MGDVNGDVIPNSSLAEPRTTKVRWIELEDKSFSVGEQVTVEINLAELAIKGMQFTLESVSYTHLTLPTICSV